MENRRNLISQLVIGVALILSGGALLLENQGLLSIGPIWRFWPLIVVGVGIVKFVQAESRHEQSSGLWLFLIGVWLTVSVLKFWGLTFQDTWPAVFIAFGVSMLWKGLPAIPPSHLAKESHHAE